MRHGFLTCALAAVMATASLPILAQSTVELYPHLSPTRAPDEMGGFLYVSPSFAAYQSSVLTGLAQGGVAVGSGPTGFVPLNRTDFTPFEVTGTPFVSWRGDLAPGGAFAGEFGTYLRVAARVVSSTSFNLGDVTVAATASDFDVPSMTLEALANQPSILGNDVAGRWWGNDGIRGTGDDVLFDNASLGASTLLNELFYTGAAFVNAYYNADDLIDFGSPASLLQDANGYFTGFSPYTYSVTFNLAVGGQSLAASTFDATITPVPEPATWALMSAAFSLMAVANQRRRRRDEKS